MDKIDLVISLVVIFGCLGTLWRHRRNFWITFSILWLGLAYLPISNIFVLVGFVQAERCLYLIIPPGLILVGQGIEKVHLGTLSNVVKFIVLILCMGKTWTRSSDWSNEFRLNLSGNREGTFQSKMFLARISSLASSILWPKVPFFDNFDLLFFVQISIHFFARISIYFFIVFLFLARISIFGS